MHFVEYLAVGGIVEFMAASFLKEWWPKINVSQLEVRLRSAPALPSPQPAVPRTFLRLLVTARGTVLASCVAAGTFWHHARGPLEPRH